MENLKNILQVTFICISLLYTFNFIRDLIERKKSFEATLEWIGRGFCFSIGVLIAFGLLILIVNVFQKGG
ncbi:hypothetical protein [Acinetobacter soli]|uniref:hypothetical protein n=1 Tax=Acinetobacter soli TaxID=487316 RepID=UPI00124F9873|nr:hypothetical protein [Acinetobacter soli]